MNSFDIKTIDYYAAHSKEFFSDTIYASMKEVIDIFVGEIPDGGLILDWGCGSGRDSKCFLEKGYTVIAADASPEMCKLAARVTGLNVLQEDFLSLASIDELDGIWACASLLHLRYGQIDTAFSLAYKALKPKGVLYASFKYGNREEYRSDRWFCDMDEARLLAKLHDSWETPRIWISEDVREARKGERWINMLVRKPL